MYWKMCCRCVQVTHSRSCFYVQCWYWSCGRTDFCLSCSQLPRVHVHTGWPAPLQFLLLVSEYFPFKFKVLSKMHSGPLCWYTSLLLLHQNHNSPNLEFIPWITALISKSLIAFTCLLVPITKEHWHVVILTENELKWIWYSCQKTWILFMVMLQTLCDWTSQFRNTDSKIS